jgi:hypothetical protein
MIGCVHVFILVAGKLHSKEEWHNGLAVFFIELKEDRDMRATPPVLSMSPCTSKLDEEKSKHGRFGSAKWFWPSIMVLAQHFCTVC